MVLNMDILKEYKEVSKLSKEEIYKRFHTRESGLTNDEVVKILNRDGLNKYIKEKKKTWFDFFINSFKDFFIMILFGLAIVNYLLGDHLGSIIIVLIALISAMIRFSQDYSEYLFNQKLKSKIYSKANVIRSSEEKNIKAERVCVGDIVKLNAGSIIPADLVIIESKDLFINESVFTGESKAIEKHAKPNNTNNIFNMSNICLMESSVISGSATGVVIRTGINTYIGSMGKEISKDHVKTNFDKGMASITRLLLYYMIGTVIFVLIVDGLIKDNIEEAIMFALSVAVGITPSMLPMIVNVNLTKGSKSLAQKKTLVKRIESIQNLGAVDTLCTDKTGTLTENNIVLQRYINVNGEEDISILKYAYLNSYFSTGIKNIVDKAIVSYAKKNNIENLSTGFKKVDEIPFDYSRKKLSVYVNSKDANVMITKGALEEIMNISDKVKYKGKIENLTKEMKDKVRTKANELARSGMQVIALAEKNMDKDKTVITSEDEGSMTFLGFVGFLDPAKKGVKETLDKIASHGITIKILTGDGEESTKAICDAVSLDSTNIMSGTKLDKLSDKELKEAVEKYNIYVRLNPLQKERVVKMLRKNGHVVGYMGDGVNDAPSLHEADVGISVNTATDIAKESSDIILLEKSLNVIYDGIIEGRKVYGNIIKYMKMALSDDFGDVFSILIASIFLPFLPLLPIQMLFQDFIYDFSQIGIPYDNVDEEFIVSPKKWNTKGISRFMFVMGIISSIVDVLGFIVFWFILGYNSIEKQAYFQTSWFVLCLLTELLVIHNVRTSKRPFIDSHASKPLTLLTLLSMVLTIITPIIFSHVPSFGFVILPLRYYLYLILLLITYVCIVTITKYFYIKKYHEWL